MGEGSILQICLSPSWGGLEMVALETAIDISGAGTHCLTVASHSSPLAVNLIRAACPVHLLNNNLTDLYVNVKTIRKIIRNKKIKTVVVQNLRELYFARLCLLFIGEIKLVGFSHTFLSVNKKDLYHQFLYSRLDNLIALTEGHRNNLLQNLPISSERINIIPNSVDIGLFNSSRKSESLRAEFDPEGGNTLIALVGRLDKAKGQLSLVSAAGLLMQRGLTSFKVLLVGEETLRETGIKRRIQNLIQELHLENHVILTGFRSDIPEIMASVDLTVMASHAETFGRVNIEAMASGSTLIASRAGGVVDIIDDKKNGLLFTPGDDQDLADKLEILIRNSELRKNLSQQALDKVQKKYSKQKVQADIMHTLDLS